MSNHQEQRCPVCGKVYTERPALSRRDGKTHICPDCGMREALEAPEASCRTAQGRRAQGGMTLWEAVGTLDGVIPAPDSKMVDLDHLAIATAWMKCKKALVSYSDMQDRHDKRMDTAQDRRQEYGPLTLEELREMDGAPVYLPQGESWALVTHNKITTLFTFCDGTQCTAEEWYRGLGKAYRQKPEVCGK